MSKELVLVTGGSGFVAPHCILKCLQAGYRVRTTIRSSKRENDVLTMLKAGGATNLESLEFAIADLTKDEGWKEAAKGCTYILHVASPFPSTTPKHEDELIIPARDGTLRVLRAARDAGVKRVVITSSQAAIAYGHGPVKEPLTEKMWTNVDGHGVTAYQKSKTLAERAAWDFVEKEGGSLEMATVCPTMILGPILGPDFATSVILIQRLLSGDMPGCPNLEYGIVDVRDLADLHMKAMTDPKAKGERFLACAPPPMTVLEMSQTLHKSLGSKAKRVPTRTIPNFVLRIIALWDAEAAYIAPDLGKHKPISNEKATSVLGWRPRSNADAAIATAESLFKFGLVKTA